MIVTRQIPLVYAQVSGPDYFKDFMTRGLHNYSNVYCDNCFEYTLCINHQDVCEANTYRACKLLERLYIL